MLTIAELDDLNRHPQPAYPQYADVRAEAKRRAGTPIGPGTAEATAALMRRRGTAWCQAVLGKPVHGGAASISVVDAAALAIADERHLDPPQPEWLQRWKADTAAHHEALQHARAAQEHRDRDRWHQTLTACAVEVDVRANLAATRARGATIQHLRHVVPLQNAVSGRSRRHPAGRALCQTGTARPYQLGEPTDDPGTCARCLDWMPKLRPAPPDPAAEPTSKEPTVPMDIDALLDAARVATAHNHGNPIRGHTIDAAAVRIDLTSWPRATETRHHLVELGYATTGAPQPHPDGYGWTVTVTGWNPTGLAERGAALELAVFDLEREHTTTATAALGAFRRHVMAGLDEDTARRRVVDETRADVAPRGAVSDRQLAPVSDADLTEASEPVRDLLARIAAAQTALHTLAGSHPDTADAAIGLYLEYRDVHGYSDEDQAANKAIADVAEGTQAIAELARHDLDARLDAGPTEASAAHVVALARQAFAHPATPQTTTPGHPADLATITHLHEHPKRR